MTNRLWLRFGSAVHLDLSRKRHSVTSYSKLFEWMVNNIIYRQKASILISHTLG